MITITPRFSQAVEYARVAHAGQVRKGSGIPYLYHLLAVASLVLEYGGTEEQAIAGLLHDVIEDCGAGHADSIREQFGEPVLAIVQDCTDGTAEGKAQATDPQAKRRDWWDRKQAYLQHLAQEPMVSLLVSGCDKLHNARAILTDLEDPDVGLTVFERFTGGREETLRYYASIARLLRQRQAPMAAAFDRVVESMHALAGAPDRAYLEAAPA